MAFFTLSRKLQVVLIASSLAVAPAGCRTPGERKLTEPGDKVDSGTCKTLDVRGVEVKVTRSAGSRATLTLELKGDIPEGTEIEDALSGEGIEVEKTSTSGSVLTVEISHEDLAAGEVGTLLVDIRTECGSSKATFREKISICKQAGGLKILEGADSTCQGIPPAQDAAVIVDPVPYPVDPPPPPPDPVPYPIDDPPPPPPDPVPMPSDPAPQPVPKVHKKKPPEKKPPDWLIVDCVPEAMAPTDVQPTAMIRPVIVETDKGGGIHALGIADRFGADTGQMRITWACSGGSLDAMSGPRVRWTSPGDGKVHAVMAAIEWQGHVVIETWRFVPPKRSA